MRDRVALGLGLAAAATLRFWGLGRQSFWIDEVLSVEGAERIQEQGFAAYLFNKRGPLYDYMLAGLVPSGTGESMMRLPSALCGVALVLVVYLMAKQLASRREALLAVFAAAVSPFAVWYSQEARYVAPFMLLSGISILAAHRFLERESLRSATSYVVWTLLTLFTFVGGIFVVLGQNLWVACSRPPRKALVSWVAGQAILAVAFFPWLIHAYGVGEDAKPEQTSTAGAGFSVSEVQTGSARSTELIHAGYVPYTFAVGYTLGPSIRELHEDLSLRPVINRAWEVVPAVLLTGLVLVAGLRHALGSSRRNAGLLLSCLICPIAGAYVVASVSGVAYNVRYTASAFPAFIVLVASGLSWWARRGRMGKLIVGGLSALFVLSLVNYYSNPGYWREDNRGAAALLERNRGADEPLVVGAEWRALGFYYSGSFYSPYQVRLETTPGNAAQEEVPPPERLWVAATRSWEDERFREFLKKMRSCFPLERAFKLPGFEILAFRMGEGGQHDSCGLTIVAPPLQGRGNPL